MDKPVVDVYSKYPVTGMRMNWRLEGNGLDSESVSLGVYMQYALAKDIYGRDVAQVVIDNALHFSGVEKYYVRDSMSRGLFRLFTGMHVEDSVFNDAWQMYNRDPWDRRFPNFVNGTVQDGYDKLEVHDKFKYGFWVYYKDRVVSSDYSKNDVRHNIRYRDEVPLLILHSTTIEGFVVACLDVIQINKI